MERSAARAAPPLRATPTAPGPHVGGSPLRRQLRVEWEHLRRHPRTLRRAAGWGIADGPLVDLAQMLTVVGYELAPTPEAELALRRLVHVAADDQLAGRVVLERLLPGLLAVARRRRDDRGGADPIDELIASAWIAIATYNPHRRPRSVAAALISDADYRAFRLPWRRASSRELASELTDADLARATAEVPITPSDELAELFATARESGIAPADLALLLSLLTAERADDVAAAMQVTPRTIRNRRDRVTDRLREIVLAA